MGKGDRCSVKTRKCNQPTQKKEGGSLLSQLSKKIQKQGSEKQIINSQQTSMIMDGKTRSASKQKIASHHLIAVEEERMDIHVKDPSLILIEDDSNSTHYDSYASPRMNGMFCHNANQHASADSRFLNQYTTNKPMSVYQAMKGNVSNQQSNTRGSKKIIENSSKKCIENNSPQNISHCPLIEDPNGLIPSENPTMRSPASYACFMEVPCVYPTEEEFNNPYQLFSMLHSQGYAKHGIIKIIPPKNWKPEYSFDKIKEKISTRTQVLAELSEAQPFQQNTDSTTYKDFKKMAEEFSKLYRFQTKTNFQDMHRKIEYEFWEHIEHPELFKDELEVEYAADLPSKKYGSAFSFMDNMTNSSFNLNNINSIKNSLFQHFTKDKNGISGISNPWIYLGMMFASFCWHVEDLYMCALNYLHIGEAKTWYGIPPEYKYKFEEVYKKTYPEIFQKKPDVLFHINLMLSPAVAAENGIPVYRTEQKAGEFIFTFPKTYHAGFSHGFNCGEAVNVITFDWFQNYKEAVQYYQTIKHPTKNYFKSASFAIEWLISQVIYNLDTTSFDNSTLLKIKDEWQKIVNCEEEKRKNVMEKYGEDKVKVYEFSNKNERYDRHICWQCGYYSYYSYLFCNTCIKKSCLNHENPCKCKKTPQLFIRFTEEDFQEQEQLIETKMKQNNCC